ncbi:MAG: hypothetical protein AB9869_35105 [Verrucomicrobiia bacterium]
MEQDNGNPVPENNFGSLQAAPDGASLDGTGQDNVNPSSKEYLDTFQATHVGASENGTGQDRGTESLENSFGHPQAAASAPSRPTKNGGSVASKGSGLRSVPSRPVFALSDKGMPLTVPEEIGTRVSPKRQAAIVKSLNRHGFNFMREGPITFEVLGFQISAYDPEEMIIWLCS